ncbi:MAG: thioredoxin domain-containing protein [Verrucomicrobiales bacterium]|nr:thioredoxin domain-containing protein [Verrucomicrobiales bacterium]
MKSFYLVAVAGLFLIQACQPSGDVAEKSDAQEKKVESEHLLVLTTETFQKEVIESDQLVMVDFWAPWCPPCLELAPAVSEIADDYAGKVKVGKVDVNEAVNKALMDKYVDEGIPLILFFKGGEKVEGSLGLVSKGELEAIIKKHL